MTSDQRREVLEDRLKRQQQALKEDGPAAEAFWRARIAETERRLEAARLAFRAAAMAPFVSSGLPTVRGPAQHRGDLAGSPERSRTLRASALCCRPGAPY